MPQSIIYNNLPGPVGDCLKPNSLSTTATVPVSSTTSLVFTTGHIGLDLQTGELINSTDEAEFKAIFDCLDVALKHAGIEAGLNQAYKFVAYLVNVEDEKIMHSVFQRRFPGATPTWSTVLVQAINVKGMRAEIVAEGVLFRDSSG
ncbi:hypothetical protein BDW74DRAFT_177358 [Aspergillus multicolor]|uniref:uncharacterized protein n=1 Tax=Aspergillus multicolor TaxID=41759 RepID=UPI003CCD5467